MKTKFRIGQKAMCLHPYAYRGKEPFMIVGINTRFRAPDGTIRQIYIVEYADGKQDQIPIENEGGYQMVRTRKRFQLCPTEKTEEQK